MKLTGIDWMQHLYKQKKYEEAEKVGYQLLFKSIQEPKVHDVLSRVLAKLDRPEEAATYLTFFHRLLVEHGSEKDKKQFMGPTERRLDFLSKKHNTEVDLRLKSAEGKEYKDPGSVGELWMTGVELTPLTSLHAQYAWKLIGGRKDAKSDWVHNQQGIMHRSGMKYVADVDGRQGVLFTGADKGEAETYPTVSTHNDGKCKFLRIGVRGYAGGGRREALVIEARSGDTLVGEQKVSSLEWTDVKFDVSNNGMPFESVTIEVKKSTRSSEGIWFDYIEFFDN